MEHDAPQTAREEWARNWPLVLCSVIGIAGPIIGMYVLGQFLAPLEKTFGWSRTVASSGMSVALVLGFLMGPLVGRLADRMDVRILIVPGLVLNGLALAAMSLANGSAAAWVGIWSLYCICGSLAGPTVWLAVLSGCFVKGRNLAMGIALCGTSVAAAFAPASARLLIDAFDWRVAFQVLAVLWLLPPLVLTVLVFRDRRPRGTHSGSGAAHADAAAAPQHNLWRIYLSSTFLRLALGIFVSVTAASAYILHLAPVLMDRNLTPMMAATIAGSAGLVAIPGKLGVGALFDRLGAATVWISLQALLAIACVVIALPGTGLIAVVLASWVIGLCAGGFTVSIACIVSRYFAVSIFGSVYGPLVSLTALSGAVGPLLASLVHDATGGYTLAFWAGVGACAFSAAMFFRLSPEDQRDEVPAFSA